MTLALLLSSAFLAAAPDGGPPKTGAYPADTGVVDDSPIVGVKPSGTENLDIIEKRGQQIPRDAFFTRSNGADVTLGPFLGSDVPVLLALNYSACPMLCGEQLSRLAAALGELELEPGEDYKFVSISIDPLESPATASLTRQNFVKAMNRSVPADGVDFLVGTREQIDRVAGAVGFQYRYVPEKKQYAHFSVLMVLSPKGMITRYLYGFPFLEDPPPGNYDVRTMRLSLGEASDGKVSSIFDRVLLSCFRYDEVTGKYSPVAWNLMRWSAAAMVLMWAAILIPVWVRSSRGNDPSQAAVGADAAETHT